MPNSVVHAMVCPSTVKININMCISCITTVNYNISLMGDHNIQKKFTVELFTGSRGMLHDNLVPTPNQNGTYDAGSY